MSNTVYNLFFEGRIHGGEAKQMEFSYSIFLSFEKKDILLYL